MTLARAFAAELESGATEVHTLVGNLSSARSSAKSRRLGDAIKSEQVRMTAAIFYAQNQDGLERDGGERAGQQGRQTVFSSTMRGSG